MPRGRRPGRRWQPVAEPIASQPMWSLTGNVQFLVGKNRKITGTQIYKRAEDPEENLAVYRHSRLSPICSKISVNDYLTKISNISNGGARESLGPRAAADRAKLRVRAEQRRRPGGDVARGLRPHLHAATAPRHEGPPRRKKETRRPGRIRRAGTLPNFRVQREFISIPYNRCIPNKKAYRTACSFSLILR